MNDQELLPTFEPSENDMIKTALAMEYEGRADKAVDLIRMYEPIALKSNRRGFNVRFSGGKDSVVLYDLTVKSGVKFKAYYSATGIDPPEVVKFIRDNYLDVTFLRPLWKGHRSFFGMLKTAVNFGWLKGRSARSCLLCRRCRRGFLPTSRTGGAGLRRYLYCMRHSTLLLFRMLEIRRDGRSYRPTH